MSATWVPFSERPRPDADLAAVRLTIDRMKEIKITGDDEAALGRVFAWLMGQCQLAREVQAERDAEG